MDPWEELLTMIGACWIASSQIGRGKTVNRLFGQRQWGAPSNISHRRSKPIYGS